jgi:ABC-type polysaccharide/polyol phosphate transport system ATPase subunit
VIQSVTAIRVQFEDVVQHYRVVRERPDTLKEVFTRVLRRNSSVYQFAALKGVSFSIAPGEAVGIIGRNGSGKSTALKIIAGVFRPTSGTVRVNGRVAALIELAAGFHPDLTGRENIVINGLLLGLSRKEIVAREARIIEFAELGDFIDSPVKQYSSGMFMRLGFAIASEVDPDILLMDEILSVGDASFQEKCHARVAEFRRRDKTIILVSHDMTAVRKFCKRVIVLHAGEVLADGTPDDAIARYEEIANGHVPTLRSL